jgi:hypothetical protein
LWRVHRIIRIGRAKMIFPRNEKSRLGSLSHKDGLRESRLGSLSHKDGLRESRLGSLSHKDL